MRIGIASGFWSQNIGNAFFQLGGKHLWERVVPGAELLHVPDAAGNWTLRNKASGNPPRAFDFTGHVSDLDLLVIQGPSLSWYVDDFWRPTLERLRRNGTRIALSGVAFYRFDEQEIQATARFLREAEPECITTRDSRSYELLLSMGTDESRVFDGIDSAFWTPYESVPELVQEKPILCATFDRYMEPRWCEKTAPGAKEISLPDGTKLGWSTSERLDRIAARGKGVAYASALIDRLRSRPARLGGYTVVRPEHRSNPPMHWKAYGGPNGFMSDEPWSYLALYKAAEVTLSDRVHACVAALAHGRSAMLFNSSPRGSLLDRVAGPQIRSEPVSVEPERLAEMRADQEAFLKGFFMA